MRLVEVVPNPKTDLPLLPGPIDLQSIPRGVLLVGAHPRLEHHRETEIFKQINDKDRWHRTMLSLYLPDAKLLTNYC
jgi:hypothetical protein